MAEEPTIRGLHSFPFPLNFSLLCPFPLYPSSLCPPYTLITRGCVQKVLKLSSNVSDVFPKVLELSFELSECKPLPTMAPRRNVGWSTRCSARQRPTYPVPPITASGMRGSSG